MKNLDEILENVTEGGQWFSMLDRPAVRNVAEFATHHDSAYAARSARHFPALVRALDLMITAPDSAEAMRVARNAMSEALKD